MIPAHTLQDAAYPFEPWEPRDTPAGRQFAFGYYTTTPPRYTWVFVITTDGSLPSVQEVRERVRAELDSWCSDACKARGIK